MANPHRGEVDLVVGEGASAVAYVLRLSYNSIAEIETILARPFPQIAAELSRVSDVSFGTWRALFWGALREHHPKLSLLDAGELMGKITLPVVVERIGEALKLAFPEPEGDAARPQ